MIKDDILDLIKNALKDLGFETKDLPAFSVEHPDEISHGDYSTNIALILARKIKQNPVEFAKNLVTKLEALRQAQGDKNIKNISIAGPGFINFYLTEKFFESQTREIIKKGKKFGQNEILRGQKTIVEYTDPNPFKEFHIGHLMSNSIGEAISRIIESFGSKIIRVSYGGDVGLHVAKSIYTVLKRKDEVTSVKKLSSAEQLSFWARSYVDGSTAYETIPEAKTEIDNLNRTIFEGTDKEINKLYAWGRKVSIKHFQEIFKRLDTKFKRNFWESEVIADALKAVNEGLERSILEKSEGAVIFKGENHNLHTRVFVNSKGVPTYEAKELGLGVKKSKLYNFDKSVIITGNEQNDYFKVLLVVLGLLRPQVKDKTVHIGHGMLRFASGKMSSRKGNVVTGISLLEQVKENILEKMKDREMSEKDKAEVAEIVTVGAVRYSILKQAPGGDIIFDFDKSISFEGDSGPYLQYSCVRALSILEKAKEEKVKANFKKVNSEISNLEKIIYRFPEIVERAGKEYAPHYLALYLTQLASEFSTFYAQGKIVDKTDVNSPYKVALTSAFLIIMQNGLNLLGIKVPKRM